MAGVIHLEKYLAVWTTAVSHSKKYSSVQTVGTVHSKQNAATGIAEVKHLEFLSAEAVTMFNTNTDVLYTSNNTNPLVYITLVVKSSRQPAKITIFFRDLLSCVSDSVPTHTDFQNKKFHACHYHCVHFTFCNCKSKGDN